MKKLASVIIIILFFGNCIGIGFADAIPSNRIWLFGLAIICSLLIQVILGYVSGVFQDAMNKEEDE